MSNANAVGDPRAAAAPGKYDLKSGENGHLARAEPLAGRSGGFGARSCTGSAVVALGVLLQIEWLRKTRGTQAFRGCRGRRGRDTVTTPTVLRRGQGRTMRLDHKPALIRSLFAAFLHSYARTWLTYGLFRKS